MISNQYVFAEGPGAGPPAIAEGVGPRILAPQLEGGERGPAEEMNIAVAPAQPVERRSVADDHLRARKAEAGRGSMDIRVHFRASRP